MQKAALKCPEARDRQWASNLALEGPKVPLQTAQRATELANSEHERLLAALKASRAGTWRWNIVEDIVEWDDALCEVYGISREQAPCQF